jgi:hypothetical protein
MFKWLNNLFKSRDKKLVAIIEADYYWSPHRFTSSAYVYCYENAVGKRSYYLGRNKDYIFDQFYESKNLKLIISWSRKEHNLWGIPTYDQVSDGVDVLLTNLRPD